MLLPSKITPYGESILPFAVALAESIRDGNQSIASLLMYASKRKIGVTQLIEALDLLFVLGKIELDEYGQRILYAG